MTVSQATTCMECGMHVQPASAYHPFLFCELYKAGHHAPAAYLAAYGWVRESAEIDTLRAQLAEAGATIDRAMREVEDHISEMVDAQQERDELKAQLAEAERVIEAVRWLALRLSIDEWTPELRVEKAVRSELLALLTPTDKDGGT